MNTMDSATAQAIEARRSEGSAAFVGYLPAGFPNQAGGVQAAQTLARAGADIIEIGLPYSDPSMDGPVIEAAAGKALAQGFRVRDVFASVEAVASTGTVALIMTYYNLIFKYGVRDFARDFAASGGAGLITPDLIPEEADEWIAASEEFGLDRIFLVAQSSSPERLSLTAKASRGFVYAASTMGVTGTRESVDKGARTLVERTREAGAEHVCLGIGVSTPQQAREVATYADGVIVGSALVRALGEDGRDLASLESLATTLAEAAHARG